jgi:23S rRNA (cytidine2498-2'-O)-methyltransferase
MSERAFLWVTHQVAVTRWVKAEVAARAPHLKFAFSRPGLTTFKVDGGDASPASAVPTSFARAWGLSLGRADAPATALEVIRGLTDQPVRLHVFERDIDVPVDEQDLTVRGRRAAAVDAALRAAAPSAFLPEARARAGDRVIDVVVPHGREPDEPWLIGVHDHDGDAPATRHGPWPGGVDHVPLPAEAPSRAWCKIEEALRWADLEPAPGETCVEIGSAPGGASYAMLCRGVNVLGVDPGEMHAAVTGFAGPHGNRFTHLHMPAAEVPKKALPRAFEWLLCDVNLAPMVALKYIERFVALAHGGLRAAVLTLKLNDDGVFEALPRILARIDKLGARTVRVTQLPSHRSEVVAILTW